MFIVDMNADIGESFGQYQLGNDEKVVEHITSANIACGYHAGDHNVLHNTVKLAAENGVSIGAHPGFPDLMGFGRREINTTAEDVFNMVVYQIGAIQAFANVYGQRVEHVKPHGALYNMAAKDKIIAEAIAYAVKSVDAQLILYGLAGSELVRAGQSASLRVAEEVFADRTYQSDGTLTPRSNPNAIIHDPDAAIMQAIRMVREGVITALDGTVIPVTADTICVHGDEPQALEFVKRLRKELAANGVVVKKLGG